MEAWVSFFQIREVRAIPYVFSTKGVVGRLGEKGGGREKGKGERIEGRWKEEEAADVTCKMDEQKHIPSLDPTHTNYPH